MIDSLLFALDPEIVVGSVIVPGLVLWLVSRGRGRKFLTRRMTGVFLLMVLALSDVAHGVWGEWVNGQVYYEWDTILAGCTMVAYEAPLIEGTTYFEVSRGPYYSSGPTGTWLAAGWSQFSLYFLWLGITCGIYAATFLAMYAVGRTQTGDRGGLRRWLIRTCVILCGVSAVCGTYYINDVVGGLVFAGGMLMDYVFIGSLMVWSVPLWYFAIYYGLMAALVILMVRFFRRRPTSF